ncbi:SNF1-related protein kinase regulatory subunit gamma-like PV42a, partial [Cucurbita argyrosperma subsp. argyrosperma]
MQQTAREAEAQAIGEKKVKDLMKDNKRLVEVPYSASLAHTMNVLVANRVVAVPVAAPPGQWIGAGGSMIMETDKQTGVLRKHYIGMVTMLDILAHIAGEEDGPGLVDLERKMAVPVSSIIGNNVEGLSLWTLSPNTSVLECMELFSMGIHRAMVPIDGEAAGVELVKSASSYRMLTQMDVLRFLSQQIPEMQQTLGQSVKEMGAINENVMAITDKTKVIEAIKCMKSSFLNATALEFTETIGKSVLLEGTTAGGRELVTCGEESSMKEVMEKVVSKHVHRIWVTDEHGLLLGLISLSDMIRAIRVSLLSQIQT